MKTIWHTHNSVYRWLLIGLYTWNLYNCISQCHSNKLNYNTNGTILGMEIIQLFFERNKDHTNKIVGEILLLSLFCC